MESEEPRKILGLREVRCSDGKMKYQEFWDEATNFINEDVGTAVDDLRHT